MKPIPTAEEFLDEQVQTRSKWVTTIMIEFAKLHVETALKEASEKAECNNEGTYGRDGESTDYYVVDKDSILNAYPLSKIV